MSDFITKVSTRNKNGFLNCKFCTRIFFTSTGLEIHLKIDHGPKTVSELETKIKEDRINVAEETNKKRTTRNTGKEGGEKNLHLNKHIRIVLEKLKADKNEKSGEVKTHDNLKKYQCPLCDQILRSDAYLGRHTRTIHKRVKIVKCEQSENIQIQTNMTHENKETEHQNLQNGGNDKSGNIQTQMKTENETLNLHQYPKCKQTLTNDNSQTD